MHSLAQMFQELYKGVHSGNARYEVLDDVHVMDTQLGIEYHLYPSWEQKPFKITHNDKVLLKGTQMSGSEADILEKVRCMLEQFFTEHNRKQLYNMWEASQNSTPTTPSSLNLKT